MDFLAELHPKIVHFPIAFFTVYPVIELIAVISKKDFFSKAALLILLIGVVTAVAAVLTGNQAFTSNQDLSNQSLAIFSQHELYANIITWLFTALLIFRYYLQIKNKLTLKFHLLIVLIGIAGMYFAYQAGNYGGKLAKSKVYNSVNQSN